MGPGQRAHHQDVSVSNAAVDASLAALADPQRRRIVELLSERPRRAGELAEAVGVSAPAMSRHLRTLKSGGLVVVAHPDFDARVRIYTLRREGMVALKQWLEQAEVMWAQQLSSFKDHLESDGR
jgi:DNA-binding transcriptional ArsR family regulator